MAGVLSSIVPSNWKGSLDESSGVVGVEVPRSEELEINGESEFAEELEVAED